MDEETASTEAIRRLLERGYWLRNKYRDLRTKHAEPEERQPAKYYDLQGNPIWMKADTSVVTSPTEALRAAEVHARWQSYRTVELPFHPSYWPEGPDRTPLQEEMSEWRKEMLAQFRGLIALGRNNDPLAELLFASGDSGYRSSPGELNPMRGPGLQGLAFQQVSEALGGHVRQLADELERINLREALLVQIEFDLPTILKRAKGKRTYERIAEDMGVDSDTVKSW